VNIDPDAETLAEIASAAAEFVGRWGSAACGAAVVLELRLGAPPGGREGAAGRALLHEREPALQADGGNAGRYCRGGADFDQDLPVSRRAVPANVLIFPNLDAANISYKLLSRVGGAEAIGPILVGMAQPVQAAAGLRRERYREHGRDRAVDAQEHGRRARA